MCREQLNKGGFGAVGQTIDEESTQALSRAMDTQPHGTVSSLLLDGIKPNQHHHLETVSETDKQPIGTQFFKSFSHQPRLFVVDLKKHSVAILLRSIMQQVVHKYLMSQS